jgi:ubiquinone/menaquinone biosynthesis C-methylase UbiE
MGFQLGLIAYAGTGNHNFAVSATTTTSMALTYTGERMMPEHADGSTFWEHVERYRFAAPLVRGLRVLDIACGEGYGTAALAISGAAQVIGVDCSPEACVHARAKYHIDARVGSAEAIPLANASVDVIVSFETIEHVEHPELFLDECHRVLTDQGMLIISTPNLPVYHQRSPDNPFHCHEMTREEFESALGPGFQDILLRGQCVPQPRFLRRRVVRRLLTAWHHLVAPKMLRAPSTDQRENVLDLITRKSTWRDRYDPYRVQRMSPSSLDAACFLVATARRRSL